nr:MAG TPA: hypothetical protein [Caudoviricetes sp.]
MALEYFCCFNSYRKKTRNLSDSELGRLFRALMLYNETGEKTQLNGREETAFDFIAEDIDAGKERYEAKCAQNKANRGQRSTTAVNDGERTSTNANDGEQTLAFVPQTKNKKQKQNISFVSNDTQDICQAESLATRQLASAFSAKKAIEDYTQDEELRGLLFEWLDNRKKKRAPETKGAIGQNLDKLAEMASESNLSLQDYMREIVRMGWQAFYPIRSQQPAQRNDGRDFDWLTGQ